MTRSDLLFQSNPLEAGRSGTLLEMTPEKAGWERVYFAVRRLVAGDRWETDTEHREAGLVLLEGRCRVRFNGEVHRLGPRKNVFTSYPHAVYLPPGTRVEVEAEMETEFADCRCPAAKKFPAQVVRPEDCGYEIRGGGNASRQIVDILPPTFPADRLLIVEVFTPSGNWSSYPPHKHDEQRPPLEVRLEETYYYRFNSPEAYGFQRVYTHDGPSDATVRVTHGDLVLVRAGYHPFVSAYGFDAYYLNVLAGESRSMASFDDPRYVELKRNWPPPDPRLPLVARP